MNARKRLPKWIGRIHRAWLSFDSREVLYKDLAKAAAMSIKELEEINKEMHGGDDNGWFVNSVTTTRAVAGDKLWSYLETLRREVMS